MLCKYDFKGKFGGFSCYRITSKGKRLRHDIYFNGGIPIERKNYRPNWAKDGDEQFVSMDKEIYYKNKKIILTENSFFKSKILALVQKTFN